MKAKALMKVFMILSAMGLNGCGVLVVGTAAVVGTAGLAGYTVYKGGEAVVSTVGSVGSSAKESVQRMYGTVVVSQGTLKAKCKYTIAELYPATKIAFNEAGFDDIAGRQDALAGTVLAKTVFNEDVAVKFELLSKELTAVEIRIGSDNLEQSEYLYDQILITVAARKGGSQ